jgi:hypothetical protein
MRTLGVCTDCHEEREIVSHGRCAACNMQFRRSEERIVDPHATPPRLRKERQKLRKAYTTLLNCIEDLNFSDSEMLLVKEMAEPHIRMIEATMIREDDDES